jgi:hypothetical protein
VTERLSLLKKEFALWNKEQETRRSEGKSRISNGTGDTIGKRSSSSVMREQLERERLELEQAQKVRELWSGSSVIITHLIHIAR